MITYPSKKDLFDLVSKTFGIFTGISVLLMMVYIRFETFLIMVTSLGIFIVTLIVKYILSLLNSRKLNDTDTSTA